MRTQSETLLNGHWASLLRACRDLGSVLIYNQGPAVSLFARARMPRLITSHNGAWAIAERNHLMLDFNYWRRVVACHEAEYGELSVVAHRGGSQFGIYLSRERQARLFQDIVSSFDGAQRGRSRRALSSGGRAPWKAELERRAQRLRESGRAFQPQPRQLRSLLEWALRGGRPMRISLCNDAAYMRHGWVFNQVGGARSRLWARSDKAIAHMDASKLDFAWIVGGRCPCCGDDHWALEFYDNEGRLLLSLQSADDADEADWRRNLERMALHGE